MLNDAKVVAFVATADGARARAFYESTLGLRVVADDDFAIAIDAGGTAIRVAKVGSVVAAPYTVLGFHVSDIAASVRALRDRGVTFERYPWFEQDDLGVWTAPSGTRVAWFKDPDGNVLSLSCG